MEENLSLRSRLSKSLRENFPKAVDDNKKIMISVTVIFLITIGAGILLSNRGKIP